MRVPPTAPLGPVTAAALAALLALPASPARAAEGASESPAAGAIHWADSYEEALKLAEKHDELVLVDFYTDWCGWCRKLDRDVFAQESFQKAAAGVVGVKVHAEKNRELANRYGARSYPRLFFLASDGRTLEQIRGYLNLEQFTTKVKQVKAGDTEYHRYKAAASDPNDLNANRRFARFLSDAGLHEEAIPYWQQVHDTTLQRLFTNPDLGGLAVHHREALLELGRGYLSVGLSDVARQHLDEAVTSYPGTPEGAEAMLVLAELEMKGGDTPQARSLLERVVSESPRSPAARQAQLRLRQLQTR